MRLPTYLCSAAAIAALPLIATPASAAITVIGNSSARMCFEAAAANRSATQDSLDRCDHALNQEALTGHDLVATHVNRGILRLRRGQVDAAIEDFDHAIARDANEPESYLNKGVAVLRRDGNWEQAVALFNTSLEKRTRRPAIAYYGRGVAHEMGGRAKEAYRDYRQASVLAPDWDVPRTELSRFRVRNPGG